MTIKQRWNTISHLGVNEEMQDDGLQKSIILTNRLSLVLGIVFLLATFTTFLMFEDGEIALFMVAMSALCFGVPYLNKLGRLVFAKLFLSAIVPVGILLQVVFAKTLHSEYLEVAYYYEPRFLILASILIPLILLDTRNRLQFWSGVGVVVFCLLIYDPFHSYFNVGYEDSELRSRHTTFHLLIDAVVVVLFVSGFIFLKNLNLRYESQFLDLLEDFRQSNNILTNKRAELSDAYDNLKATSKELKRKNQKITDSLRYALNIQETILPTKGQIKAVFSDHFAIYKPKDIVSGDFYWLDVASAEETGENDKAFLAVVDCTGHGVPGAFMSMTGNTLLHEIIDKLHVYDTARVLELMDERLKAAFQDRDSLYHGMDISLCLIEECDDKNFDVLYSGAKRPLYYYNSETDKIEVVRGTNRSIGDHRRRKVKREFKTEKITLPKNSILYLTSDGFADQASPKGEKFGTARLLSYLEAFKNEPLDAQQKSLQNALDNFCKGTAQRDDMTVLAVQL
ncbi:MAG: SpoIIE family protein phosphatase [Bacteroidota bacterium]